mmetsp:Transcript_117144/g.364782  ORF Transcript_117144/g.364782 Transcript_117144/m.364782 type:complete len:285 (+) Transcript_117144:535-1389(+)
MKVSTTRSLEEGHVERALSEEVAVGDEDEREDGGEVDTIGPQQGEADGDVPPGAAGGALTAAHPGEAVGGEAEDVREGTVPGKAALAEDEVDAIDVPPGAVGGARTAARPDDADVVRGPGEREGPHGGEHTGVLNAVAGVLPGAGAGQGRRSRSRASRLREPTGFVTRLEGEPHEGALAGPSCPQGLQASVVPGTARARVGAVQGGSAAGTREDRSAAQVHARARTPRALRWCLVEARQLRITTLGASHGGAPQGAEQAAMGREAPARAGRRAQGAGRGGAGRA